MILSPKSYTAYKLFHEGILALSRAENAGIRVDLDYIEDEKQHLTRKINHLEKRFKETRLYNHWECATLGKVNISSNAQLSNFLYGIKKIKPEKFTYSGQGATDEEALKQLDMPELIDIIEMRKLRKVRDTYLDAFAREQVNGYIHPFFNLHLVRTFRSSSDHPNWQNIPVHDQEAMQTCRKAIYPRPSHQLLNIDYSAIEVKVAACYTQDATLLKYVRDPKSDMHRDIAKEIFMLKQFDKSMPAYKLLRQSAKNGFVFPEFYGDYWGNCAYNVACNWGKLPQNGKWKAGQGVAMPEGTLADHLISNGIKSLDAFKEHMQGIEQRFWQRYKGYKRWQEKWYADYIKNGYIDLLTGFRCYGPMDYKHTINYPIQGSAFHCLLWSFIETDRMLTKEKLDSRLVGQIHDDEIIDANPSELDYITKSIHKITCEDLPAAWAWINVPLEIEMEISPVDGSWAEKEKLII